MLLRHGRTAWNAAGRWQGHLDPELDETGVAQVRRAAALLAALSPHAIVSSDLRRAAGTAAALGAVTGLDVCLDPGLRETYIGSWQGLTSAEVAERWADELAGWQGGDVQLRPGGGENRLEVADRVVAAVRLGLLGVPPGGCLVVVTHGGAARVAVARLLGLEHGSWGALGGLSNCCWSVVAEDASREPGGEPRWHLLEHNAGTLPQPVLTEEG
ncbi:MAG: histidine phosphatase family protein [Actinomycetota bacterium]|nr:histidine phosphatase family protein [Actinomycetota bacterium]